MEENASAGIENLSREGGFNKKKSYPVSNIRFCAVFVLLLIVSISTASKKIQLWSDLT